MNGDYENRNSDPGLMTPVEVGQAVIKELPTRVQRLREMSLTYSSIDNKRHEQIEDLSMAIADLGINCVYQDGLTLTWYVPQMAGHDCYRNLIHIRGLFADMQDNVMAYGNVIKSIEEWDTDLEEMNKQDSETLQHIKNFFVDGGKESLQLIKDLEEQLDKFTRNEISHSALSKYIEEEAMLDHLKGLNDDFMHNITLFINATKDAVAEAKKNHHKRYWNTILALYNLASFDPSNDYINSWYLRLARGMSIWRQPKPMTQRNLVCSSCMHKPQKENQVNFFSENYFCFRNKRTLLAS
jgi:hypothetical protein